MKLQTGIDMEEIDRIASLMKNPRFLEKYFGEKERELFRARHMKAETVASNFCAKEAFVKAIGTGFRGVKLADIQVLRDDLGKPCIELYGKLKDKFEGCSISVSTTHTRRYASAIVIIELAEALQNRSEET